MMEGMRAQAEGSVTQAGVHVKLVETRPSGVVVLGEAQIPVAGITSADTVDYDVATNTIVVRVTAQGSGKR